jgi:nitrogen PTS system EIIA component
MNLADFVVRDAVITDLEVSTKEEAIQSMVRSLCNAGRIDPANEDNIVAAIMKREELGSTGIGKGIAVPHTKHPSVDALVSTIAIAKDGVDFQSLDGEDVYILFLLISPPDRPGDHLRGLESISRHLKNDDFCNFLRQATSAEAVMETLHEADNGQLG